MSRLSARMRRVAWVAVGGLALAARARADDPLLSARVACAPVAGPGRIVCQLDVAASSGKLVWVDALVVQAPPFARPLRSRIVLQVGSTGALGTASAKLALVATGLGKAELQVRVRGVLCREGANGESCGPELAPVSAVVEVGQRAPAAL